MTALQQENAALRALVSELEADRSRFWENFGLEKESRDNSLLRAQVAELEQQVKVAFRGGVDIAKDRIDDQARLAEAERLLAGFLAALDDDEVALRVAEEIYAFLAAGDTAKEGER